MHAVETLLALTESFPHTSLQNRDRYWRGDASAEGREALLPRGSPRAEGYATPPSHFQSPYQSPGRPAITSRPLAERAGVPPPQVVVTA